LFVVSNLRNRGESKTPGQRSLNMKTMSHENAHLHRLFWAISIAFLKRLICVT